MFLEQEICRTAKRLYLLYCVFHSIRFKVNKGWAQRSPFLCPVGEEDMEDAGKKKGNALFLR